MRVATPILIAVLATCWASPSVAEWQQYGISDGLAGASVYSMLEDRDGNLWFGTSGGLSRYDGAEWRTFTRADGLMSSYVQAMAEDHAGNLWFGTDIGVIRYDGTSWRGFSTADGVGFGVLALMVDRAGNVWAGGYAEGVSRYDGTRWQTIGSVGQVRAMLADRAGNLWFAHLHSTFVSRFDGTSWRTFTGSDGLAGRVVAMQEDRAGSIWFAANSGGVSRFDGTSWRTFTAADGLASSSLVAIGEDNRGYLWFSTSTSDGVSRYDGTSWRTFTIADGLASNSVGSILRDRAGNLWFGTHGGGLNRYDGTNWRTLDASSGLPESEVLAMLQDRAGNLWFASYGRGVSRFDGTSWQTFTTTDGLASNVVVDMLEDADGSLWFCTDGGLSRYDGASWRTFTTADGLASNSLMSIMKDSTANLWVSTNGSGVCRYDGTSWRTFTIPDGAPHVAFSMLTDRAGQLWFAGYGLFQYDGTSWRFITARDGPGTYEVYATLQDHSGNLWFGTYGGGVSRFDGTGWRTFSTADGLSAPYVFAIVEDHARNLWFTTSDGVTRYDGERWRAYTGADWPSFSFAMLEDRSGNLWFGSPNGTKRLEPDLVAPRTVHLSAPPGVSANRAVSAVFLAAYAETGGIRYSSRLDGGLWSPWALTGAWQETNLSDGVHLLEGRTRDEIGNIDPRPDSVWFEIDATPPTPVIASPASGAVVRDVVEIRGVAADARFEQYVVEFRRAGMPSFVPVTSSPVPVAGGKLTDWDTGSLPDGDYELRLAVTDTLGLTGAALVAVKVQRNPSVRLVSTAGGDVTTADGSMRLYFPPHAFREDALVTVTPLLESMVPVNLPGGATRVLLGDSLDWGAATLAKPATLELSYQSLSTVPAGALALYASRAGGAWERIGGTVDASARRIAAPITWPGRYALFTEQATSSGAGALSPVSLTPRVFSPTGGYADRKVGISFTLGRAAPVTVRVYSRSGRLIREVVQEQVLGPGQNLVHWDGRDRDGAVVIDGSYVVTVEALGRIEKKPLAVVR